ncbi:MAG: SusC/RagA family TonB-linked outer membrane protein [Candidatus Symbiothrix sp.]|jgi:TonB-linked SusC/RagA family outer membrane protein|nr:SusC/RagA family TonB-linked outer membrane protein [Candidatus Symbiothrix sp.]
MKKNLKFLFSLLLIVVSMTTMAIGASAQQSRTVSGVVFDDETKESIIGASVAVPGTSIGMPTDVDGKFQLSVPSDKSTIVVTYLGYQSQTVTLTAGQSSVTINLVPDVKTLDEFVVVGYGSQRVKDLTGAASTVQMNEIANLPGASILDALAGQVIGLNVTQSNGRPGATGSFTVRHPAPIMGSSVDGVVKFGPLIVIDEVVQVNSDGEPDMTAFNMLDHSEIESITVLKDASAAIYGSRASQGVILVKTKRGKIGKPKISYSGKFDFSNAVSHAKTMSAYETGVFTNRMFNQIYANNGTNNTAYNYSDSELNAMKGLDYNWLDRAWHSASSQRHSLSVDGGTERMTYFAGITYQDQGTNLGSVQDFDKWTFRTGGEINVAAGLKLSASISGYGNTKTNQNYQAKIPAGPWGSQSGDDEYVQLRHMPKFIPMEVTTNEGTFFTAPWAGPHTVFNYTDDDHFSGYSQWNFFANEASKARKYTDENGFNSNFSLSYDVPFIKGLSLKGTYAISYTNTFNNEVGDYYKLALATNTNVAGQHLIGDYTQWVYPQYGRKVDVNASPAIIYNKVNRKSEQMNFMINYNRSFGDHDVAFTGVVERAENEGTEEQLTYNQPWDTYNGVSAFAGELRNTKADTYFTRNESGSMSYIGRLNYKYADRYLFQFILRADASTKFAPENYWGTFPTGSVGWVASEEKFFKNSDISKYVDYLKFRYSLGKTGKDNVKAWSWLSAFNTGTNGVTFGQIGGGEQTNSTMFLGTANRNIKWDQTIKNNIGIDFNILSNRLGASVDYYYDKTTDLLMKLPEDPALVYIGASLPAQNYGAVNAWGWEFSLRWHDKINQSLVPAWGPIRYGVGVDYSISWHKVIKGLKADFDYPSKVNDATSWTGAQSPNDQYGFKVWKGTSSGDGILRTQQDIDNYWSYLEQHAIAAGGTANDASYFGNSKSLMYPGMIAYQDLAGGNIDYENKTIQGPDGRIMRDEDYAKLASNRRHGINTKLSFQWGNFNWASQIATSWGGYQEINQRGKAQSIGSEIIWSQFAYMSDMFDPATNPNGKYPSMAVSNAYGERSDFWMVNTFRMYVRNMTLGYSLPKNLVRKVGVENLQLNLTGNNLWDFYNPYPDKFRNMYDAPDSGYPTLRTWTLGVNITL